MADAEEHDPSRQRYVELKRILEERRREILGQVKDKMRDVRMDGGADQKRPSTALDADPGNADDIELALIQMKGETLVRISEALQRLEAQQYGDCFECGDEIAGRRLRALPFAVRCKDCEERREVAEKQERLRNLRDRNKK